MERATAHLDALAEAVSEFFSDSEYGFVTEWRERQQEYVYKVHIPPSWPVGWGVLVGDFAHQLRATLDNLMWELVLLRGGAPTRRTQFPIFTRRARYRSAGRLMIDGVSRRDRGTIERLQPYRRWGRISGADPLAQLAWLSNVDKHRVVHATNLHLAISDAAFDHDNQLRFEPNSDAGEILKFTFTSKRTKDWVDGSAVFRFRLAPTGPNPVVSIDGLGLGVSFGDRYFDIWWLQRLWDGVEEVMQVFAPEFES